MRTAEVTKAAEIESRVDLSGLSTGELEAMAEAGQELVEIQRILTKTGDNVVGELLRDSETFYEWDHYPKGDVYDRETHSQYYYHAHPPEERFENEHGHFHTFLRPKGMPPGITPAEVPDAVMPEDPDDALSHLIAISMTPAGLPFRIFTVNRWVTGEVWYSAKDVAVLLDFFKIDHTQPSWPVNRWITAMIQLYKPQIIELVEARDRKVAQWQLQYPDRDVFEDRSLEVTSYLDINLDRQVQSVAQTLLKRQ